MLGALERMYSRVQHALGRGVITLVDDTGPIQVAQIRSNPLSLWDQIPILYHFGFSASPPLGSEVTHSSINGDPMSATVVATGHRASRPKNLQPGQSVLYDQAGTTVKLTNDHKLAIAATGTITLSVGGNNIVLDSGGIHIHGTLSVDGGPIINNGTTVAVP